MNAKEKLYALLDDFINNRMYIQQFCDLFSLTYDFKVEYDSLSELEKKLFSELSRMAYGYVDSEEDRLACPQHYFNGQQIVAKVDEVVQCLGTKCKKMRFLVVDGMFSGTGIHDEANGGYLEPEEIGLSIELTQRLTNWLAEYEAEHYRGFKNETRVQELDREGKEIAIAIRQEIPDIKIGYYSDAYLIKEELMVSSDDGSLFWFKIG